MAIQMNIGDKPGISCCLISCAALAQNTSSGVLWLSWTSVPLDRKTNFDCKHLREVLRVCYFADTTWEIVLQQVNAEALQYGVLETWALFVILLLFFSSVDGPVTPSAMGMVTSVLNCLLWAGNIL